MQSCTFRKEQGQGDKISLPLVKLCSYCPIVFGETKHIKQKTIMKDNKIEHLQHQAIGVFSENVVFSDKLCCFHFVYRCIV
jgi:hypothetical protein